MKKPRISYIDPATTDAAMQAEFARCATRGHAAAGEPGGPRPCAGGVLVVRQHLARHLPHRHRRPRHQGAVPALRVALGDVRVLRQPALDQGGERRRGGRGPRQGPDQFREPRRATTSSRRPLSPTPRRSPGTCRSTTSSGRGCTSTSASRSWSRSAISSPSPWASSAGCARSTSSTIRCWSAQSGSMAPGFETEDALKRSKADPTYWANKRPARSEAAE